MTLRLKVVIAVMIALAASAVLIYGLSRVVLIREIKLIEADQMKKDVSVAHRAIDRELAELDARAFDYSAWDASYQFIRAPSQEYIDSNLPDNLYKSLGINLLAYIRPDGTVVYGRLFDLEKGSGTDLPAGLGNPWTADSPLFTATNSGAPISGILTTSAGTFLLACRPILTSAETGPPRGALVMGRLLNAPLIATLSSQTQLNITSMVLGGPGGTADAAAPLPTVSGLAGVMVAPLDSHTIAGYERIDDIFGKPALLLQVQSTRVTYQQGRTAVTRYLLIVLGIVFLLGVALDLALSRFVLVPMRRLVGQVKGLAARQSVPTSGRVEVGKGAEFKSLGMEINNLLGKLQTAQREISQLYGLAREQADRDSLTGFLSRRAVFDELERRLSLTRDRGGKLALLMIDVDGFKQFNDAHGHLAGDEVLKRVARALTARTRDGDLVGRYGGDEFLVVLPHTDAGGAVSQAERLLEAADELIWTSPDGTDVPISLSIGVSAYPSHGSELNELLAFADANLYAVKQSGRGAVSSDSGPAQAQPSEYGFGMLDSLITALSEKDQYTRRHAEEVASFAVGMAEALGLNDRMIRAIRIAGLLHDVGKTGIPASLLLRPGPLTPQERLLMRRHVDIGLALIRDVPELDEVLDAVGSHHEQTDGTGYPNGLKGSQIPLSARILAIADRYSAMISFRPYRRAYTPEEATQELRKMAGTQLDERLVDVFLSTLHAQAGPEPAAPLSDERAAPRVGRLAEDSAS